MNYEILKAKNLYGIDSSRTIRVGESCDKNYIEDFCGILLMKGWCDKYYVYMDTGFSNLAEIPGGSYLSPAKSEDIFEEFDNKNDADRLYNYLESLTANFTFYKLPKALKNKKGIVLRATKFYPPRKGCKTYYEKTLFKLMDGVELSYTIYSYKDEHGGYRVKLNNSITICLDDKEDVPVAVNSLISYVNSLKVGCKTVPDWVKLSNIPYMYIFNWIYSLGRNKCCRSVKIDRDTYDAYVFLSNDDSKISIYLGPTTNNSHYWGKNCEYKIKTSGPFANVFSEIYDKDCIDGENKNYINVPKLNKIINANFR